MVNGAAREEFAEIRTFKLEKGDVLLVRVTDRVRLVWVENLYRALKRANPEWEGAVITLGYEQELHVLPDPAARQLYAQLKAHFEDHAPIAGRRYRKR